MRHSALVILGLLAEGERHGYELEREIKRRNMRLWAKIGASTVYKALSDLETDGALTVRAGQPERGAGKQVFTITDKGRQQLSLLLTQAFQSRASLYSDRIVAMAFSGAVSAEEAVRGLEGAHVGARLVQQSLQSQKAMIDNPMSRIIIDFYIDVMEAEDKAFRAAARELGVLAPVQ